MASCYERARTRLPPNGRGQTGFLTQEGGVLSDNLDRTATIFGTDVEAANGIIHAIDAVELPFSP